VKLARRTTAGSGPPVVLLHGLGDDATTWDRFTASLDRPTIAFDLRGHGTSPRSEEYTLDAMAGDVLADLPESFDLVGHSMGGYVASLVASAVPERLGRLVLEDTPVPPRAGPALPDDDPPARPEEPIAFDWAVVTPMRRAVRAPNPQWWQGMERLGVPTLWLSGGPTSHLDPERVAAASAAMPSATMRTIPVGHLIHADAPAEFARVVAPFLAGSSAPGEPAMP
jgi:3-oxoadipate enol-lactonase